MIYAAMRPHRAQHPLASHPYIARGDPGAYLAMPLAVERAGREDGADRSDQGGIGTRGLRPRFPAVRRSGYWPARRDARARGA
jgi:hypothetical protein